MNKPNRSVCISVAVIFLLAVVLAGVPRDAVEHPTHQELSEQISQQRAVNAAQDEYIAGLKSANVRQRLTVVEQMQRDTLVMGSWILKLLGSIIMLAIGGISYIWKAFRKLHRDASLLPSVHSQVNSVSRELAGIKSTLSKLPCKLKRAEESDPKTCRDDRL